LLLLLLLFLLGDLSTLVEEVLVRVHVLVDELRLNLAVQLDLGLLVLDPLLKILVQVGDLEAAPLLVLLLAFAVLQKFTVGVEVHVPEPHVALAVTLSGGHELAEGVAVALVDEHGCVRTDGAHDLLALVLVDEHNLVEGLHSLEFQGRENLLQVLADVTPEDEHVQCVRKVACVLTCAIVLAPILTEVLEVLDLLADVVQIT